MVKRVLARTHKRCGVQLEVIPAELDDDDDADDLCRTFSVTCALEVDVCAVYNYLREKAGVCGVKRLENDGNNMKIVVIVDSSAGRLFNRLYVRIHRRRFTVGRSTALV